MTLYDAEFYRTQQVDSLRSARALVPLIAELIHPTSVVDVGCGVGTWLSVYKELGIRDVVGMDGDYVESSMLLIDRSEFLPIDISTPFRLERKFDLVQSLEVAEHLDERAAEIFVQNLVRLGDIVVFSAAIPFQRGTNHVNEQFPEYWAKLFQRHGYEALDCIRPRIWSNGEIQLCYRQNVLVFEHTTRSTRALRNVSYERTPGALSVVHPEVFTSRLIELLMMLFNLATQLHACGQLSVAETLYNHILGYCPRSHEVWHLLGQLALAQGNLEVGLQSLNKAIDLDPHVAAYYVSRSRVHAARGDSNKTDEDLQRASAVERHCSAPVDPGFSPAVPVSM